MTRLKHVLLSGIILAFASTTFAQQNYELVQKDEYEEWYEKPTFVPDARISGEYHFGAINKREDNFQDEDENILQNDFILRFRSETQSNISFNLAIANTPYNSGEDRARYTGDASEDTDSTSETKDIGLFVDEMFLEYNHNPHANLRLGRHYIDLGFRKGLIYKGKNSALTQSCRAGTWCYYAGTAIIGPKEHDNFVWGGMIYPVYTSGLAVPDLWDSAPSYPGEESRRRYSSALFVEGFQIYYNEESVPLSGYGGATYRPSGDEITGDGGSSPVHVKTPAAHSTNPNKLIYYTADYEYYGLRLEWMHKGFRAEFAGVNVTGTKKYHVGPRDKQKVGEDASNNEVTTRLYKASILGWAYYFAADFKVTENLKFGGHVLRTTGDKLKLVKDATGDVTGSTPVYEFSTNGFYEVVRGTYGDANIYFDGYNGYGRRGRGEGHSVNNLTYANLFVSYRSSDNSFGFDLAGYKFLRTEKVLNADKEKVDDIGWEVDISFQYSPQQNLKAEIQFNWFQAGGAYTPNDGVAPVSNPKNFSNIILALDYYF